MRHLYTFTFFALAAALGLSSCSSSKNAQNGPDMYSSGKTNGSDYVSAAPNDQYVQMKSQDYDRWSYFDDYNSADAYYAPAPYYGAGYGAGFGYGFAPSYGFGYSPFYGPTYGLGFGFGDPYMMWNNYFIWNSWYNPYFYNPYYGGGVVFVGKSPTSVYNNLRPFNTTSYKSGLAHAGINTNSGSRNRVYRPGMTSTTAYNSHVATTRSPNTFRPVNNNNGFRPANSAPTRSYSPAFHSSGGGFRGGGFGGRH
ncbi:MAG TPA: hypothetical protein VFE32_12475 [Puia sp.]|jgi:hypothetical protein|nr:hypothetical protein [Puia sp.]